MGWSDATESYNRKQNSSKFFKLQDDGERARLVLLTEPEEQEKDGPTGLFVVYSIQIWNIEAKRVQTWDMTGGQFKALLGLYRVLGHQKIYGSELVVVRTGRKGDPATTYTWASDGAISDDVRGDMAESGIAPALGAAPSSAPAAQPGRGRAPSIDELCGGIELATTLDEAKRAMAEAWSEAEQWPKLQAELQARFDIVKDRLTTTTVQRAKPRF